MISGFEVFRDTTVVKRFVERNLELSIEQMVDICKHFISGLNLREPETYSECFDILAEHHIFSEETGNVFKSMVRYGNILIHAYDGIDDSITYGIYKQRLEDFRIFISGVREFLQKE